MVLNSGDSLDKVSEDGFESMRDVPRVDEDSNFSAFLKISRKIYSRRCELSRKHVIAHRVSLMLSRTGLVVSREFRREELVSREIPSWLKLVFKSIFELTATQGRVTYQRGHKSENL